MTNDVQTSAPQNGENNKPTHTLRRRIGVGRKAEFETLGVAWLRDDGGLYIKLSGTQIIDGGFYAFPIKPAEENETA